jgi:Ca-activated chloride channel family protein
MIIPGLGPFAFAHPWVLLLLLGLPVLAWLHGQRGRAPAVIFSSVEPLRRIGRPRKARAGAVLLSLLLLAEALFIIALARPQLGSEISQVEASGIDIMLAVDVSRSMLAEDFTIGGQRGNRIEAVKQVTQKFIEGRPNDRIGIVAFAGRPYLVSPLTLDHDWLLRNLERLQIGLVEDGTAIGSAIASSANRLKERDSKSKIIVLLTDGDNNSGKISPATAAEAAHALGIKIYTIGAGTRGYAPVPIPMYGQTVYRNVKVEVDEETLKKIAATANGQFYRATDTKSLTQIYEQIDKLEKSVVETKRFTRYRDLFHWFLAPGFSLVMLQLVLGQTVLRKVP